MFVFNVFWPFLTSTMYQNGQKMVPMCPLLPAAPIANDIIAKNLRITPFLTEKWQFYINVHPPLIDLFFSFLKMKKFSIKMSDCLSYTNCKNINYILVPHIFTHWHFKKIFVEIGFYFLVNLLSIKKFRFYSAASKMKF